MDVDRPHPDDTASRKRHFRPPGSSKHRSEQNDRGTHPLAERCCDLKMFCFCSIYDQRPIVFLYRTADILQYFNVGEVTIDEYEGDEGELILDISGKDMAVLIGRHGKTLDALQFIMSMITVRTIGFRYPVIVDVEGYKNRQRQKLESIAHSSANRAASQHRKVGLRPMTPYERRIIHIALRDDDRVETVSEGEGPSRHVVVVPL